MDNSYQFAVPKNLGCSKNKFPLFFEPNYYAEEIKHF